MGRVSWLVSCDEGGVSRVMVPGDGGSEASVRRLVRRVSYHLSHLTMCLMSCSPRVACFNDEYQA